MIEAKAINVNTDFDCGKPKALKYRKDYLKKALLQAESKCEFLNNELEFLSPSLPREVRYICPVVVTNYPEYIWSFRDYYFLNEKMTLPRILTLEELPRLLTTNLSFIKRQPYTIQIR